MNAIINSTPNGYGFGHDWTLVVNGKSFYLGQDAKFCSRVLGMTGRDVVNAIGDNDLTKKKTRTALANFIMDRLCLSENIVESLEPWELCCQ